MLLRNRSLAFLLVALMICIHLLGGCTPNEKDWETSPYKEESSSTLEQSDTAAESGTAEASGQASETTTGSEVWTPFV